MPGFAVLHRGQRHIAITGVRSICRIRPWNAFREIAYDFPLRKQKLRLRGISQFERAEQQAFGGEGGNHSLAWILHGSHLGYSAPGNRIPNGAGEASDFTPFIMRGWNQRKQRDGSLGRNL